MPIKTVEKAWGTEQWLVNEPKYCAKDLIVNPGWQCSKHFHINKTESFVAIGTGVFVEVWPMFPQQGPPQQFEMNPWAPPIHIPSFTPHRFRNTNEGPSVFLEVSSHHDDDDVVRLEESRKIDI